MQKTLQRKILKFILSCYEPSLSISYRKDFTRLSKREKSEATKRKSSDNEVKRAKFIPTVPELGMKRVA